MRPVISCAWSAPAWMKSNHSTVGEGSLRPDMYQAYADYLAAYVLEYKKRYDLDIYGISPANEPNYTPTIKYASSLWSGEQLTKFLRNNLIPTFAQKGVTAEIMLDDHAHWSDEYIDVALADRRVPKPSTLSARMRMPARRVSLCRSTSAPAASPRH